MGASEASKEVLRVHDKHAPPGHEINRLTERLFAEGYTKENYPDYVKPYFWFYGGFQYTGEHLRTMVFETPCGLLEKGSHFTGGHMSYMGIEWMPENDNPVINCPYRKESCELNHELLRRATGGGLTMLVQCAVHATNRPYDYDQSVEKAYDEREAEKERLYDEFKASKNGRVCRHHCYFNEWDKTWRQHYDPMMCRCASGECTIRQEPISEKKGNVFYDLKISRTRKGEGIFEDETVVSVLKGLKALDKPRSMTICEEIVKHCQGKIQGREERKRHSEMYFDKSMSVEIVRIYAARMECRDLIQDLKDAAEGIEIHHGADTLKAVKEQKRQRAAASRAKKLKRIEDRILTAGLENMEDYERDRAYRLLGEDRVEELLLQRDQQQAEPIQKQPAQISLFE